ncbi:MAG: GNAT family N-acetyltransferase [Arthrobacter sp.]|jgi:GNAT superfamily N-acetyltransferase|nr:GNAT family N-acetyltransferase [Arthrobacter sp.]
MIGGVMGEERARSAAEVLYRPAGWGDLEAANALSNRAALVDDTDEIVELEDQRVEWQRADFVLESDVRVAVHPEAGVVAWAEAGVASSPRDGVIRAHAGGVVVPEWRGLGIGSQLLEWCAVRAREKAREKHPGLPVVVGAWGREERSDAAQLLVDHGFVVARYFSDMRVSLEQWQPSEQAVPAPGGPRLELRAPTVEDAEAVRLAHNEAFQDHWGSSEQSAQRWSQMWAKRVFRPGLSRIAVDEASGEVLAYVLSEEWVAGEQYVSLVGTRREARGLHLASTLLQQVLAAGRAAGLEKAELGVDAASPTGANGVYERAGFSVVRTGVSMERPAE